MTRPGFPEGYGADLFPPEDFLPRLRRYPAVWELPLLVAVAAEAREARHDRARARARLPARKRWGIPYGLR